MPSHPSSNTSLLLDQAIYLKFKQDKKGKVAVLTDLTKAKRVPKTSTHQYFINCKTKEDGYITHAIGWIKLKKRFVFENYQYCWKCGLPQGESTPATHPIFKRSVILECPFDDLTPPVACPTAAAAPPPPVDASQLPRVHVVTTRRRVARQPQFPNLAGAFQSAFINNSNVYKKQRPRDTAPKKSNLVVKNNPRNKAYHAAAIAQPLNTDATPLSPLYNSNLPNSQLADNPKTSAHSGCSVSGTSSSPPPAQNVASSQQAATIAQPVHTGAKNGTAAISPSFTNPQAETSALSESSVSLSVPLNQADGRRSGRNPVPSKRHEQMNEIDGKAKNKTTASTDSEKENIPGATPEWTIASHDHLLNSDLGKDWMACVQAWFELEQELGYGSQAGAKGALPFTATRPQEWASWTSKSRGGVRNYQCTPSIVDAAEFGIAIQGWWNSIQPPFRKSDTGIPAAVYSCPTGNLHAWASLRKGGPNGLISLLTLLLWWGQALAKQSQWQIDSSPDWKHMVLDVTKCLNTMKDSNGAANLKRKAATTSQEKDKKRARISV